MTSIHTTPHFLTRPTYTQCLLGSQPVVSLLIYKKWLSHHHYIVIYYRYHHGQRHHHRHYLLTQALLEKFVRRILQVFFTGNSFWWRRIVDSYDLCELKFHFYFPVFLLSFILYFLKLIMRMLCKYTYSAWHGASAAICALSAKFPSSGASCV